MTSRRAFLGVTSASVALAGLWPDVQLLAQQAQDFIAGPPVGDIAPVQLSPHVWMVYAPDGFPTPENRGMIDKIRYMLRVEEA